MNSHGDPDHVHDPSTGESGADDSPEPDSHGAHDAVPQSSASSLRRLVARLTDYWLFGTCVGFLVNLVDPRLLTNTIVNSFLLMALWIPVEALFTANFGHTPGKFLLNIRAVDRNGEPLGSASALHRAGRVWLEGMWLGIPIAWLASAYVEHRKLTREGSTSYDQKWGYRVLQEPITPDRGFMLAAVWALMLWRFALLTR